MFCNRGESVIVRVCQIMTSSQKKRDFVMRGLASAVPLMLLLVRLFSVSAFTTRPLVVSRPSLSFGSLGIQNGVTTTTPTTTTRQCRPLQALLDPSLVTAAGSSDILSPNSIHEAFSVATFFPQPFWLLLTLLPNWDGTKKIMGGMGKCVKCVGA